MIIQTKLIKFRLLLHQRMLEMQNPEESLANSSSVANLLRQFSSFQQSPGSPGGLESASGAGLDLSYKREDMDDDKDSIAESNDNNNDDLEQPQPIQQQSSSRSRRKPAAPQWVRPEWNKVPENETTEGAQIAGSNGVSDNKSADLTINGVCVMNYNFKDEKSEDSIEENAVKSEDKE